MNLKISPQQRRWFAVLMMAAVCCNTRSLFGADKSGVSPNSISLPKGPGSIEGLGESFQPTLNTGTAKYRIVLSLPLGTAGLTPSLSLNYEGGAGNGPVGFGWRLPTAFIQRQVDKGIPTYVDGPNGRDDNGDGQVDEPGEVDLFINELKEELVPQITGDFFCKNEGAFIRYRRLGESWEGTLPDGTRLEFGVSPQARIADAASQRTYSWLVERVTDTHGNTIKFSYLSFADETNLNQKYLAKIEYGPGRPPWNNFHFVTFGYTNRLDWFEDGRPGFPVRTGMRLHEITVGTQGPTLAGHAQGDFNGDGVPDNLVRKYRLDYLQYNSVESHWSYLAQLTHIGADESSTLPPSRFGYSICDPPPSLSASTNIISGINEPFPVMDNPLVDLVDLNADGLPDLLKTERGGGAHLAYLNRGVTNSVGGRRILWEDRTEIKSEDGQALLINLESEDHVAHLADQDGDGLADLVFKPASDTVYFFRNLGKQSWGRLQSMVEGIEAPPAPFGRGAESLNVKTADIDFDKRIDIIQSVGSGYRVWLNLGAQKYSLPATTTHPEPFNLSDPGVEIADFNGDRVPDLVRVRPATVIVQTGFGYGVFGNSISVGIPDGPLESDQVSRARLQDITGDGLADLVIERAEPGVMWYWINRGNYSFFPKKIISGLPRPAGFTSAVRWADINGNGTTDYILASSEGEPRIQAVDLSEVLGCVSGPNLLTRIENGIGRVTEIDYRHSTELALSDAAAGKPWPDPMPFPVSVVSGVHTSDSLGHLYATEFHYHDGYYDGVEKEFRGFARVEQIDLGDSSAPTLVTRSHFDTGRTFEAMKGKLLRLTAEQAEGSVFTDESTSWIVPPVTLYTGNDGQVVHFAHPIGTVRLVKELGQGIERRLETESSYDNFGNLTRVADYGVVENGDRTAFNDERVTTTEYAINTNLWLIRDPVRAEVKDESGNVISRAEFYYDDETFSGNNLGLITIGNLTMKREWKDPAKPDTFILSSRSKYDAYGNPSTLLDPLAVAPGGLVNFEKGHVREIAYDPQFYTFPITETIHLGSGKAPLVFQAAYDAGFGTVTSSTDFNSNATTYGYDTFARLTSIVRPGDSPDYPTAEYDYALAVPFRTTNLVSYVETRLLDKIPGAVSDKRGHYVISRDFVDGLGRKLLSKSEATETSENVRVSVKAAVIFNGRQKPLTALNPFYTTLKGDLDAQLAYESIEDPGWSGQFALSNSLVTLDLTASHKSTATFDATLRELTATNPDGSFRRTVYEPLLTKSLDENDSDTNSPFFETPMVHRNDGLGRLIEVQEVVRLSDEGTLFANPRVPPVVWITRYEYDLNDQLSRITDSQNNDKMFSYDGLKRKTFMNDPDRGVMNFLFDDASNLVESSDAKGQRITYTYDGANRILTEDYHDGGQPFSRNFAFNPLLPVSLTNRPDVAYFYDTPIANLDLGDGSVATASNVKGKVAYVWDLSGEEHTSYDTRDRVSYVVKRVRDPLHAQLVGYRTGFSYDSLDRLTTLTYPDNDEIGYRYNDRNLLSRIMGGPTGSIISNIVYLPADQQGEILYGNGIHTAYAYDSRLRLTSLVTAPEISPASPLIAFGYDFDGVSNIKSIADNRPESVVPLGDKRRNTQLFQYDDLYRLTRVQYSFTLPGAAPANDGEINYRYDRIGNMLAQNSPIVQTERGLSVTDLGAMSYGGAAGRFNRTGRLGNDTAGPHALTLAANTSTNRAYPYDPNGNMTNLDGMVATWDFKDRLVALEDESMRAEYAYDFTDRRITKSVWKKNAAPDLPPPRVAYPYTTIYVGKHFEVREFDAPTKFVFNGNTRVARVTGSLSPNQRVQRLRVNTGWNLISVAVTAANGGAQLAATGQTEALYKWDRITRTFAAVSPTDTLATGCVLWVKVSSSCTLRVMGKYPGPTTPNVRGPPEGDFLPGYGLEALPFTNQPASLSVWRFASDLQTWQTKFSRPNFNFSDLSPVLAPHEAIYSKAPVPVDLEVPKLALSLRFYHQDHIGSSSVMSDLDGALVEESANHPFGQPRNAFRSRGAREGYQFTQKERDTESSLNYFESRFLLASTARFVSVDPLAGNIPGAWLQDPQQLNFYSYTKNNPLVHTDPDGRGLISILAKVGKAVATGADIASTFEGIIEDVKAINDAPSAFSGQAILGGLSIATEILPVSVGDIKSAWRWANRIDDYGKLRKNVDRLDQTSGSIRLPTRRQAFRQAKDENGIPRSQQPDRTIKANSPEGKAADLNRRNVVQHEFTNSKGEKISIREDKPAKYNDNGPDQKAHFNSGPSGEKLKNHHYFEGQ